MDEVDEPARLVEADRGTVSWCAGDLRAESVGPAFELVVMASLDETTSQKSGGKIGAHAAANARSVPSDATRLRTGVNAERLNKLSGEVVRNMTRLLFASVTVLIAPGLGVAQTVQPLDLTNGPKTLTAVAATITLDAQGWVVTCRPGTGGAIACAGFKKGRVVSAPLLRGGKPVGGLMTVSTTTVVSAR